MKWCHICIIAGFVWDELHIRGRNVAACGLFSGWSRYEAEYDIYYSQTSKRPPSF